jgi:hypothetical protein
MAAAQKKLEDLEDEILRLLNKVWHGTALHGTAQHSPD